MVYGNHISDKEIVRGRSENPAPLRPFEWSGYRQAPMERASHMNQSGGSRATDTSERAGPSRLRRLKLEGYKSFRNEEISFGDVTVLLGANGAGKSNLVSFFRMVGFLSTGALQEFIGRTGRSDSMLFGGRRTTSQLRAKIEFRDDAGNLAAYLYAMEQTRPDCYRRIMETVRLVFPAFGDFVLGPSAANSRDILLNWREKDRSDYLFRPHQLSDGTLRFMALATLLLQPPEQLPNVIILDEPELGLHPFAISVLAAMVRSVATQVQVVLATQSTRLVDEFDPRHIVILEAEGEAGTKCHRPNPADLAECLQEYSLGELWEKNHFGGRP